MSSQNPPNPFPLNPIYNPNDWIGQNNVTIDVAYLDAHYLKFNTAQGLENLQAINVNGTSTFYDIAQFRDQVQIVDTTALAITTECLVLAQSLNNNRIAFTLNPGPGAYNAMTLSGDNLLVFGDFGFGATSFVIAPWSNTTNGLRLTQDTLMLGTGTGSSTPTHRLNTDTTQFRITSSNFVVDGNMTLINSSAVNRQITGSYFNIKDITANLTGTQMYQSTGTFYLDNNYATSGSFTFALNNSAGTQQIPLQINETSVQTNKNIVMGAGTNITFPDSTTQTTAYVSSALKVKTFTITTNQINYLIPTGVYKIDFKVIGRGGNAGSANSGWTGGSGSGAQIVMLTGTPILDSYYINISFVATVANTIGYTQVQDAYDSTVIARAYNGGNGGNATPTSAGIGGVVSPFSSPTNPTLNSNYGNAYALQGTNGSNGAFGSLPSSIGLVRGSAPNLPSVYGNGSQDGITWATGAVIMTMYYL